MNDDCHPTENGGSLSDGRRFDATVVMLCKIAQQRMLA